MNKFERIKAAIDGEVCDQVPYSIWSHLPGIDLDPVRLADETYNFFKKYDVDFVKTMNNGMYPIEDFDCEIDYSGIEKGGLAVMVTTPIINPEDWAKVGLLDIEQGALKRELYSLELLLKKVDGEAPVVFTAFSPITIANKLSGNKLLEHIEAGYGEVIKAALEVITETTQELVKKSIEMGASGIFFATQLSSYNVTNEEIYREYGEPYDIKVLEAAKEGWFNILHAHGDNIMFNILKDYPVQVFNWHAYETLPEMDEARSMTGKTLMGGLMRMDITNGNRNEIMNQIYKSMKILGRRNLILTPGCVIRYPLDEAMLHFVREAKETIEERCF